MKDQADKLREIINGMNEVELEETQYKNMLTHKASRVITITSGKGGVGKTNFTINIGIVLAEMGYRVVIIDADLGLSNVDVVLGKMAKFNLSDVIKYKKDILDIMEEGPSGIRFISGGSGMQELIKLDKKQLIDLLTELGKLDDDADIILIDTGAGLSDHVMSFVHAAKEVIIITTPEPTAITDAYALIKTISYKDKNKNLKLVVNKAENIEEAYNVLDKLSLVTERFLGLKLQKLGFILNDNNVTKAVKLQEPFVLSYKKCEASKNINDIAKILVNNSQFSETQSLGIKMFFNKLSKMFNS